MVATMTASQPDKFDFSAARSLEARVWEFLQRGEAREAIDACEQLNRQFPDFASGWHTASQLALKLNNPKMALAAVTMALKYEPDSTSWAIQKAQCVARLGDLQQLDAELQQLSARKMDTAYQLSALAMLQTQLGRRDKAMELYQLAARLEPQVAVHFYNVACMQRSLGELESAETNYDQAIRLNAADYESYKIRSDLRQQTPERNHVAELEQLLVNGIEDERGRVQVCYALAKELEDLGDYGRSFRHLQTGSNVRRERMQYDISRDVDTMAAIRRAFPADLFTRAAKGNASEEPVFVLGLPRTGTTLVERILSSHSDVMSAGELNHFAMQLTAMLKAKSAARKMSRDEMVVASADLDFAALGDAYLQSTRPLTGRTPRFVDKMPLNFLYVGLIRLALPNAKIIHLQRDAMDTCYAIYKQLFVDAYPFSYRLEELAQYYVGYRQLMEHWNAVLPGVVHTVHYEALVADLESESRRLLNFCGLEWQSQCLQFHTNPDASTTASTAQIRRPIYSSSIGKWRNYEQQLQPVADILQKAGYG
jgi:tetratricopeptide (TPR) repeat protein